MSNPITNAAAGASTGAAVGSVVPGLGTAAGAAIGGVGSLLYDGAKALFNPNSEKASAPSDLLSNDYVSLGKLGNKKQTRAMESEARLAALQQYYARQNNQQDLENQMYLTAHTAELEQQGLRNAGLSTAGDFNGTSVASPSITSPSLPSAPQVDDSPSQMDSLNFIKDVSSLLSSIKVNDSAARKNESEADLNDIDKLTRYDENIEKLDALKQSNKISRVEYKRRKAQLQYERDTLQGRIKQQQEATSQAEIETKIKQQQEIYQQKQNEILEIAKSLNKEQLKQAEFITQHQLQQYNLNVKEQMSRINLNKASAHAAYVQAALAEQQKLYTKALTALEDAKVPHAEELATAMAAAASADMDIKSNQAQLLELQLPAAQNKADYHSNDIGKAIDMLTEPLSFVLSGANLFK